MSSKEQHIHHLLPSTNPKQLMVGVCNDFKRLLCELDIFIASKLYKWYYQYYHSVKRTAYHNVSSHCYPCR